MTNDFYNHWKSSWGSPSNYYYDNYPQKQNNEFNERRQQINKDSESLKEYTHELVMVKTLLRGILNLLDKQQLTLEAHAELLDEIAEAVLDDDEE